MKLSIVIPAYNEQERLGKTFQRIREYLNAQPYEYEMIVVDDGSRDGTYELATSSVRTGQDRVLKNDGNRGKGYSVRRGILEAQGDFVLFTDADLSTPIEELGKFLHALKDGYDVAFGSRGFPESQVEIRQNPIREAMGRIFNRLARFLTFKGIRDSQCGFKCFTRKAAHDLFSRSKIDGFGFDAEILFLGQRMKYQIKEIPVRWRNSVPSRVSLLRGSFSMLCDLIRIRWLHRKTREETHDRHH